LEENKKINAVIIDDEQDGRDNLANLLNIYCEEVEVLALASNANEARKLINELQPEVVFLDINMPNMDGFEFLESIVDRNFMVVFVTAHAEFGVRAIKVNAIDYLLKPVNIKELRLAVNKLFDNKINRHQLIQTKGSLDLSKIIIQKPYGFEIFDEDQVIRFEAMDCYTKVFLNGGKSLTVSKTLGDFEDRIPKRNFFRIHRSHIINLRYLKEYTIEDGGYAFLKDGTKLEISRRRANDFVKKVKEFYGS
jgi:two-component system LytT family response regulator